MILEFPNLETLQLALTSSAVPARFASARAEAAFGEDGRVFVSAKGKLKRAETAALKKLGVQSVRSAPLEMQQTASCWMQVLPLRSDESALNATEKTPVLFDLPDDGSLPDVVNEMLRLGNDRQAFRYLAPRESRGAKYNGESRVLLRVIGPPYYSLLRALETGVRGQESGGGERSPLTGAAPNRGPALSGDEQYVVAKGRTPSARTPRAFVERHSRVWVEIGYAHPLAERLKPPAGKLLFLRPPHTWTLLDEAPFHDIYDVLDFELPDQPAELTETELGRRLTVPLRLERGGSNDVADLWVLRENAVQQVDDFVQTASDQLVRRLSFAVSGESGSEIVVLRLRPSKLPPPVLVLNALPCSSYLKFSNLFLPTGKRLHPQLRRDVVKSLLADDAKLITWLQPDEAGGFTPCRLPDNAFRPLSDWVDYVLDRDHETLSAWMQASRFDFEPFVCADEKPDRPKKTERKPDKKKAGKRPATEETTAAKRAFSGRVGKKFKSGKRKPGGTIEHAPRKPSELERHLREVEQAFLALEAPLDDPARNDLWRELAAVNAALGQHADAAVCWTHVLWEDEAPDVDDLRDWLESAAHVWDAFPAKCETETAAGLLVDDALTESNPSPSTVNALAAWLIWCDAARPAANPFASRLPAMQQFFERYEPYMPARTTWLLWRAFARLSGDDVLALARARDRLLERLFQQGLIPEHDLPGFLRLAGLRGGDRFRAVRQRVVELRETVQAWSVKNIGLASQNTRHYIDLIFAYALARLGERNHSRELLEESRKHIGNRHVHGWFFQAYEHRIKQAHDGKPASGQLPSELLKDVEGMERLDRYKVDRLRQHSSILEPHEKIDPYRRWHRRFADELGQVLSELFDLTDRNALAEQLGKLLKEQRPVSERVRIVATALELAPRLGESVAKRVLTYVEPLLAMVANPLETALVLEKGLFLAAHFDRKDDVHAFIERLHRLLAAQKNADVDTLQSLETVLSQSMRGMRKLGMRDHMSRLLEVMDGLVRGLRDRGAKQKLKETGDDEPLKLMLQVAAGWFYFGQQDRAWPILDTVRDLLMRNELMAVHQNSLACAYLTALGQAPVEQALPRFQELFQDLKGIQDSYTTNSHYSLSQLDVVEAFVTAIVSDDFTLDKAGRKWMDDDEFLVRRRVHADVRAAMGAE